MVPLAALAVSLFSVQSGSAQAQKQLTNEEVVLLDKLRQTNRSNPDQLQFAYITYRDDVKRLQGIEQEVHAEGFVICDPPIQSAAAKLLYKQRLQEGLRSLDRSDSLFEDLRQLQIPMYKARHSIVNLVRANVQQIDSFLGISEETMRFIETGRHSNLIGN